MGGQMGGQMGGPGQSPCSDGSRPQCADGTQIGPPGGMMGGMMGGGGMQGPTVLRGRRRLAQFMGQQGPGGGMGGPPTCNDGSSPKCADGSAPKPPQGGMQGGGMMGLGGGGGGPPGQGQQQQQLTGQGPWAASLLGQVGRTTVAGTVQDSEFGGGKNLPVGEDIFGKALIFLGSVSPSQFQHFCFCSKVLLRLGLVRNRQGLWRDWGALQRSLVN